jgi:hypothetical protein
MGGGKSIQEEVLAAVRGYDIALKDRDVDGQVAFFADSWQSNSGTAKADMRKHLPGANRPRRLREQAFCTR